MSEQTIEFDATLAGTNTSSRFFSGSIEGDAKVVLETDKTQVGKVLKLFAVGKRLLHITATYDDADDPS